MRGRPGRDRATSPGEAFPLGTGRCAPRAPGRAVPVGERGALDTAAQYLTDRVWKRRGAMMLRGRAAVGRSPGGAAAAGHVRGGGAGSLPGVSGAAVRGGVRGRGPLFRGHVRVDAGRCHGADRAAAAADAQFDWASESVREVLGPADGTASEAAERCLLVLRRFSEDVRSWSGRRRRTGWWIRDRVGAARVAGGVRGRGAVGSGGGGGVSRFSAIPANGARPNIRLGSGRRSRGDRSGVPPPRCWQPRYWRRYVSDSPLLSVGAFQGAVRQEGDLGGFARGCRWRRGPPSPWRAEGSAGRRSPGRC